MKRYFKAGPRGETSGIAVSRSGPSACTVVVVPKLWSHSPRHRVVHPAPGDSDLEIVISELDTVEVECTPPLADALDACIDAGARTTGVLLAPITPSALNGTTAPTSSAEWTPEDAVAALDALCRATLGGSLIGEVSDAWGVAASTALLRPLLLRDFVGATTSALRHARRDYTWRSERLLAVRGRITSKSAALAGAIRWPALDCEFEDFHRDTPLLQVIVTALAIAAREHSANHLWAELERQTSRQAVVLRRVLGDVNELRRREALESASNLSLTPSAAPWRTPLALARAVLTPTDGMGVSARGSDAIALTIDTSRVWERIVYQVLARTRALRLADLNGVDSSPVAFERPWIGLGIPGNMPRPDLVATIDDDVWILDAKYKRLPHGVPSIDDQYQMFAYSHLAGTSGAERLALIYPARSDFSSQPGPNLRAVAGGSQLWVRSIRFPRPDEAAASWTTYLRGAAASIESVLFGSS